MTRFSAAHLDSGRMIDEEVRIRDRFQFEIKLNYPINPDKALATYDLECHIFIPANLGIRRETYTKQSFYDDLQAHIRLKTPSVPLSGITGPNDAPMANLKESAIQLSDGDMSTSVSEFEYQIKLFCCILNSSLRDFLAFIEQTAIQDDCDRLVTEFLDAAEGITGSFRELRPLVVLPQVPVAALDIYAFADEYVSLLVERHYFDLLQLLQNGDDPRSQTSWKRLIGLVGEEVQYRQNRQYPSTPVENSDNEQLIFRRNVLKKYMGNVLFLDTRTRDDRRVLEQTLFGIAAGISMLFATAVLFISQSAYGPLTLPVFLALVIGYMFKDRIKELLRVYFSRKISGVLFDHKMSIYTDSKQMVGHCRESFDFVDETRIPKRVVKIRDRHHITEIESDWLVENVIRYNKRIKLSAEVISGTHRDLEIDGITDILRFNVEKFTKRMGNPSKELFALDEDDFHRIKAERVYHLNMVLTYKFSERTRYKRFRVIFNRRRIKRIETVSVEDY
jgi:hypothetical protein